MKRKNYHQFMEIWKRSLNDFPIKIIDFSDNQFVLLIKQFAIFCKNVDVSYSFKDGMFVGEFISQFQYTVCCIKDSFNIVEEDGVKYYIVSKAFSEFIENHVKINIQVLEKYPFLKNEFYKMINEFDLTIGIYEEGSYLSYLNNQHYSGNKFEVKLEMDLIK